MAFRRGGVNRRRSARSFRNKSATYHRKNVPTTFRGGERM